MADGGTKNEADSQKLGNTPSTQLAESRQQTMSEMRLHSFSLSHSANSIPSFIHTNIANFKYLTFFSAK